MRNLSQALVLLATVLACASVRGQEQEIPEPLQPWKSWVLWDSKHLDCPQPYNNARHRFCFWPSQLNLAADKESGTWDATVTVFSETWIPLPGSKDVWPMNVLDDQQPTMVVERDKKPFVKLLPGTHQLEGSFRWSEMPQRIAVPPQFGVLGLKVAGKEIPLPVWDSKGMVWLKRERAEETAKDFLGVQVYRVIEDGIPMWLRTDIELTVSGKSREEELGSALPEGWQLATVESPIPVAVDKEGKLKAQVRAGKWVVSLHAFRTEDLQEFSYASSAAPLVDEELIGFRTKPDFRVAEIDGMVPVDVNQTTFPEKWRNLPVYAWKTSESFQLVEKMRGMGTQRPDGIEILRQLWLDEDGGGLTYHDKVMGKMQQIWRLDVADGQDLGAVRIGGVGQLITANPETGSHGVEVRDRNFELVAVGRSERVSDIPATGWQSSADSLNLTLTLPPGWRLLAMLGADSVRGDWLTSWTLLDLFLTLIFALSVYKLWGFSAGLLALLAFGLSYHEPAAPRFTWFFLLVPLALLQVVVSERGRQWLKSWRSFAAVVLLLYLVPFIAQQVQSAIYPQLEHAGRSYGFRDSHPLAALHTGRGQAYLASDRSINDAYANPAATAELESATEDNPFFYENEAPAFGQQSKASGGGGGFGGGGGMRGGAGTSGEIVAGAKIKQSRVGGLNYSRMSNMQLDLDARVQTGPAEPRWNWNHVFCSWSGPVAASEVIKPIFITREQRRLLTVARIILLLILLAVFCGLRLPTFPLRKAGTAAVILLGLCFTGSVAHAQLPDPSMLQSLKKRLLETSDAFPRAADIPSVELSIEGNRLEMIAEIHAAEEVAVPLPGRLPAWSPVSVELDDDPDPLVQRRGGYLWIVVPKGVQRVTVEGLLPDNSEWDLTFQLKPRYLTVEAPGWNITGISEDGIPENQVFFARQQVTDSDQAAYDQKQFAAVAQVERLLETGLVWKVHNRVRRLSAPGKAISLKIPLLEGESVLSSGLKAKDGMIEVRLGANQNDFFWVSELPITEAIELQAPATEQWVEQWQLISSPVWNVVLDGLSPIFQQNQKNLLPTWNPWPGESTKLQFGKPEAVEGDTVTITSINHEIEIGSRQRESTLTLNLVCSLADDLEIAIDPAAEISQVIVQGQPIPVRIEKEKLIVPTRPGSQTVTVSWRVSKPLESTAEAGQVQLPMEAANVSTVMRLPSNRWILWAGGPQMGPAVRFWVVLVCAVLLAIALGSPSWSPLRKYEWILLALGLTQVHIFAAMLVVGWLLLLAWRGRQDTEAFSFVRFNFLQLVIVALTFVALCILVAVVGEGLLGNPDMFVLGNGSSRTYLQWFQPRSGAELPNPYFVSVSVWFYRLLMLLWALWLAVALLRWLKWGWQQFTHQEAWRTPAQNGDKKPVEAPP